jgi:hypothetical protein
MLGDAIQANFVQIEVGRFQTEGKKTFQVDSKSVVACYHFDQRPDLILDEPTNLDLEMIEWLESYFAKENITIYGDARPFSS